MHSRFLLMGVLGLSAVYGLVVLIWDLQAAQRPHPDASTASLHVEVRNSHSRQPVAARCYLTDESRIGEVTISQLKGLGLVVAV